MRMSPPEVRAHRSAGLVAGVVAMLDFPALDRPREFLADRIARRFVQVLEPLRIAPAERFLDGLRARMDDAYDVGLTPEV
jgi:hypothetical protein